MSDREQVDATHIDTTTQAELQTRNEDATVIDTIDHRGNSSRFFYKKRTLRGG